MRKQFYKLIFSVVDKLILMNEKQAAILRQVYGGTEIVSVSSFLVEDSLWFDKVEHYKYDGILRVCTMGLWQEYYLYEHVVQACGELVAEAGLRIKLDIVVGTSNQNLTYRKKIVEFVDENKIQGLDVKLLENKVDILTYLNSVDVLIRSSSIDSYGLCVAEALLVGTIAIATNVCHRADGALIYRVNDIDDLKVKLQSSIEILKNTKYKKCRLLDSEDAYYRLSSLYS